MVAIVPPTAIESVALESLRAYLLEKTGITWDGSRDAQGWTGTVSFFSSEPPGDLGQALEMQRVYLSLEYTGTPSDEALILNWKGALRSFLAELSSTGEAAVWNGRAVQLLQGIRPTKSGQWYSLTSVLRPTDAAGTGVVVDYKLQLVYEFVQPSNLVFNYA